ncbi:MAG: hypothetical protein GY694_02580 [Gammaproteobacteria bacterium]|nr:hypothetical protein [Gammaproteobacteria bacterium]
MELLILPDQFIIKYSPAWMTLLLLSGLLLFFVSKKWRKQLIKKGKYSFFPGVLFAVSFIFIIGGINFYVYKVVMNKEGILLFNIKQFNEKILWSDIENAEYKDSQEIVLTVNNTLTANESGSSSNKQKQKETQRIVINLSDLDKNSHDKVKILIELKHKQNQ